MNVVFWGAAQTVTGSMHLVQWRGRQLLLDCGLYQGKREEAFRINRQLPFAGDSIDAVVLSHAHIDHSGNLPSLVRGGFRGVIHATPPTCDLARIMLLDSAKIQESDIEYVNKKRLAKREKPFQPLYTAADAEQTNRQFQPVEFGKWFEPIPAVRVRFHEAGHMLGAASVELELQRPDERLVHLVFSGDIGRPHAAILKDPKTIAGAEYLIMEATYGNRLHPAEQDVSSTLRTLVQQTIQTNGKLLIPAFSVGRTQEIVYHLNQLREAGEIGNIPVFVDSPLAVDATAVFRQNQSYFDEEAAHRILDDVEGDVLSFSDLYYIRSAEYSKKLNTFDRPAVIISASGMCESGRILHHFKNHIGKPNTTVLFVGFQAPHTLGRRLLDGFKRIKIYGEEYDVRARIERLEATSGHADQRELLEWATATAKQGHLRQVALVHCDLEPAETLAQLLHAQGLPQVLIPRRGQAMPLD